MMAGYCIKTTIFHQPLISPDTQVIEITVVYSIHQRLFGKKTSRGLSLGSASANENGHWDENGRRAVAFEYDETTTGVDAGKKEAALRSRHR